LRTIKKYVISENKNGYNKQTQAVYNNRIKKYAKQALQDLTLLAQTLPENQQTEIFNNQNTQTLLKTLLNADLTQTEWQNQELIKQKQERLLPICYGLITYLNNSNLAHLLAPVGTRYMIKESGQLPFLKAIYYRGLNGFEEIECS
jgi:hypothetical protein